MKKYKIEKYHVYIPMAFIAILAILNLFGIEYWTRYGWTKPSFNRGIFFLFITISLYYFSKYKTKEPDVYACEECDNAFWEKDIDNGVCPNCGGKVKNIKSKVPKNLQI